MKEYCFNFLFSSENDLPDSDVFWALSDCLGLFPGKVGQITAADVKTPGKLLLKMKRHTVGKAIPFNTSDTIGLALCGGFDSYENTPENLVHFGVAPGGSWLGQDTLPTMYAIASETVVNSYGPAQFNLMLEAILRILGQSKVIWGFVDLLPAMYSCGGRGFRTVWYSDLSTLCLSNNAIWHARSRREFRIRSIQWGNFLGNNLLSMLGGKEAFVTTLKKELSFPNGRLDGIIRELETGVFFSVSPTPESFLSNVDIGYRLKWFAELLDDHNLV